MSTQPAAPKKAGSIPIPIAIGVIVVALAVVFFVFLKPMLFGGGEEGDVDAMTPPPADSVPMGGPAGGGTAPQAPPAEPSASAPAPAPAPAPSPAPVAAPGMAPAAKALSSRAGEIIVWGKVQSVNPAAKEITITTDRIQINGKPMVNLSPARTKVIRLNKIKGTLKPTPGADISAVGKNLGEGKPLTAREVSL